MIVKDIDSHDQQNEQVEVKFCIDRCMLESILGGSVKHIEHSPCDAGRCSHRQKLIRILSETIQELEKTRRSFKSKQIETLRKQLMQYLAEESC